MKIIRVADVESFARKRAPRFTLDGTDAVRDIISDVQGRGDKALLRYEKKFCPVRKTALRVPESEIRRAAESIDPDLRGAISDAAASLERTERSLISVMRESRTEDGGIRISRRFEPLMSAGCYVPGGLARYPSSAIMSVVPARVAGVRRIVVASPPDRATGRIDDATLAAAGICGATEVYAMGGAQAIAALALGTESVAPVDKIVGPGGPFVTAAKSILGGLVPTDMPAGPTELGVLADDSVSPVFVVADIISQAEHSTDTACYLVTPSMRLAKAVSGSVKTSVDGIEREDIVHESLEKNGFIAVCPDMDSCVNLCNLLAPEHLSVMTRGAGQISKMLRTAGLVTIGHMTPSAACDYLAGSNHILPTGRFGRGRGSLSVLDFVRLSTRVRATHAALKRIAPAVRTLAGAEGLPNHYEAVESRL